MLKVSNSTLVSMAAELIQEDLTLTRGVGESVSFSCGGFQQCSGSYMYWYQKKETEPLKLILRFDQNRHTVHDDYGHPQKGDFSAMKTQTGCELKINKVKVDHSASYYCNCWSHSDK
uniref:Immunoglobulin V-set domain-containing protein n=1 Tax=Oryzias melastigma TaxID=30732 RepID=A0A3B3CXL4_ORYME